MWAILREQGSSFISYWAVFISEALIRRSADICSDWEAYEESFVKTQRTTAMSSLVHLSSLPVTGCLDMLYVLSFVELFGEKWTSEANCEPSVETVCLYSNILSVSHKYLTTMFILLWQRLADTDFDLFIIAIYCIYASFPCCLLCSVCTAVCLSGSTFFLLLCFPLQLFLIKHSTQTWRMLFK